ncbi:MAG: hypothetical protein ABI672_05390 [Vicinamibacteria bacterium]
MQRRQIQDIAAAALFALATAGFVGAEGTDAKATALLAKLRASLGGETKLAAVKGLTFEADMRRVLPGEGGQPGPEMSGDIKLDLGGPTKYLFVDSFSPMAGMPPISIGSAIDGDTQWSGPVSAPMGNIQIRAEGGGDPAHLRARLEKDMTRLSVALLAGSGTPGVEFTYGGTAESPDGQAEVLDVKGPGDFKGKLFLDQKTSRPMMLVYQEIPRRMALRRGPGGPGGPPPAADGPVAPEMKEAQMFLSDYKNEDGIALPHAITIKVQDGPTEEWTVQKIKINPVFGADHFKKR